MDNNALFNLYERRRSIYALGKLPDSKQKNVTEIAKHCLKFCPTPFNAQSGRIVLLFGQESLRFWDEVWQKIQPLTPSDKQSAAYEKNRAFAAGNGTLLFFEDQKTISELQTKFPLYAENFPVWSLEAAGILQYMVWLALAEQNIGASLQHYNPLIDEKVAGIWNIPSHWKLLAQMPFGSIEKPADKKTFLPLADRMRIFE